MATINSAGHVVVGDAASDVSEHAVEYAAGVAAQRHVPLLIIHATPELSMPSRGAMLASLDPDAYLAQVRERGNKMLAESKQRVLAAHPDLQVDTQLLDGSPAEWLVRASADAEVVVVGTRSHSAPLQVRMLGGVSDEVATHAQGPVIFASEQAVRTTGPVVVGVDDSPGGRFALQTAVQEAERLGERLRVVHAFSSTVAIGVLNSGPLAEMPELIDTLEEILDEIIAPYRESHPNVKIERSVVISSPVAALMNESEHAQLVVVGSRGRGGFAGLLLGSTSRALLRRSACPVLVARPRPGQRLTPDTTELGGTRPPES